MDVTELFKRAREEAANISPSRWGPVGSVRPSEGYKALRKAESKNVDAPRTNVSSAYLAGQTTQGLYDDHEYAQEEDEYAQEEYEYAQEEYEYDQEEYVNDQGESSASNTFGPELSTIDSGYSGDQRAHLALNKVDSGYHDVGKTSKYECRSCGKGFRHHDDKRRHEEKHHGEKHHGKKHEDGKKHRKKKTRH